MEHSLCKTCVLPDNYPGIRFDDAGICNYCSDEKGHQYAGKEKLLERINGILQNHPDRKYDCVVGFSGGRDSTYLLWYIVRELHLKPLAVFIDSGLIPAQTIDNIRNTVQVIGADLKIIKHDLLKRVFRIHFQAWLRRPRPETLVTFCVGCRLGVNKFIDDEAIKQKIPIVFGGGSPFEGKHYKSNILKLSPEHKNSLSFILGYLKHLLRNPGLALHPLSLKTQLYEYYITYFRQKRRLKKHNIVRIALYHSYVRWEESVIEKTLRDELRWQRYPGLKTSYRGDCEIGIVRQYLYWKLLGFNDKDDHLSCLIRDHQISRDEALQRLDDEHYVPQEILRQICENAGIKYSELKKLTTA